MDGALTAALLAALYLTECLALLRDGEAAVRISFGRRGSLVTAPLVLKPILPTGFFLRARRFGPGGPGGIPAMEARTQAWNVADARAEWDRVRSAVAPLRVWTTLYAIAFLCATGLLALSPAALLALGAGRVGAVLIGLHLGAILLTQIAMRRLGSGGRVRQGILTAISPFHAMRSVDALTGEALIRYELPVIAHVAGRPREVRRLARRLWAALEEQPADGELPPAGGRETREARRGALLAFLAQVGLSPAELLQAPPPESGADRFCPACHAAYTSEAGDRCSDCGVPLRAYGLS